MSRYRVYIILLGLAAGLVFAQEAAKTDAPATAAPAATTTTTTTTTTTAPAATTTEAPVVESGVVRSPFQVDGLPDTLPAGPIDPDKVEVSIAFAKADLANVLAFLSLGSGIPIVCDAEVKGTVTITSVRKVTLTTAYDVINSALRVRGYTMVGTLKDRMIRVVTLKKAIADRATVQVGADPKALGTSDAIITQVVPLQYTTATKLRDELKPLVADDQANLLAVSSTNTLIITDTEGNVKRLLQIIELLDKDNSAVVDVAVYTCKYASASVLVTSLEKVFGLPTTAAGRGGQPNQGQPNPGGAPPNVRTDDGVMSLKGELRISADDRTNTLIISAAKEKIKVVLNLVAKLDVNTTSEVSARIFHLQYANSTYVADQLNKLFEQPQGGITNSRLFWGQQQQNLNQSNYAGLKRNIIVADVRTNSVVVTATAQNMLEFERMIKELDAPNVLSDVARTFPLKYAKAPAVAATLNSLFRGNTQRMSFWDVVINNSNTAPGDPIASLRNITVVADEKTNTLLITGQPQAFAMVENIITQLDRRTAQVFIQVAIVDVTLDDSTKFGVEWNWHSVGQQPSGTPNQSLGTNEGLSAEKLGMKYSVISSNMQALLHALTTRSNVKVYSTPSITTADNVAARISIGRDEPFVSETTETSGGNLRQSVAFKNVSITLNVTPHVSIISPTNSMISLDVQQTINELIGREPKLNAPIIANREAKTTVMVDNGNTIVIGGIIKENDGKETIGVPILSKIPGIGELFKSRTNTKQRSELMVFLTPHVLRDEESVQAITVNERNKLTDTVPAGLAVPPATTPAGPPAPAAAPAVAPAAGSATK